MPAARPSRSATLRKIRSTRARMPRQGHITLSRRALNIWSRSAFQHRPLFSNEKLLQAGSVGITTANLQSLVRGAGGQLAWDLPDCRLALAQVSNLGLFNWPFDLHKQYCISMTTRCSMTRPVTDFLWCDFGPSQSTAWRYPLGWLSGEPKAAFLGIRAMRWPRLSAPMGPRSPQPRGQECGGVASGRRGRADDRAPWSDCPSQVR